MQKFESIDRNELREKGFPSELLPSNKRVTKYIRKNMEEAWEKLKSLRRYLAQYKNPVGKPKQPFQRKHPTLRERIVHALNSLLDLGLGRLREIANYCKQYSVPL